jgi:hypothetical protein
MIKYFHELTKEEFSKLIESKITWGECAKEYPQPIWCGYPDALAGMMGCWSLTDFKIKNKKSCYSCDCFEPKTIFDYFSKMFYYTIPEHKRLEKEYKYFSESIKNKQFKKMFKIIKRILKNDI